MQSIRIPQDRIGAIIGIKGQTKRILQKTSGVKFSVDSEGEVLIYDNEEANPLSVLKTVDVIKAIGRGFAPDRAMKLFNDDEYLDIINLKEFTGKKSDRLLTIRGRIIGKDGKTRQIIESLTGVYITVYGNTIGFIGNPFNLPIAKHAIELILNGSEHATVYRYLENQRSRIKINEMGFDL
ncbi:MAG: KH domain-containing protein [archaeon]|nr:KH domain-containing protein [archaeon]